jgi:hypothetical protein
LTETQTVQPIVGRRQVASHVASQLKIRMVENVESFGAELQVESFLNFEILEY